MMQREQIMQLLPHRDTMLLVEQAQRLDAQTAEGFYTVRGDEWFLQGHFPGHPVVPGVVLCEMMAQTCCVLLSQEMTDGGDKLPMFTGLDKVRFKHPVVPGDTLRSVCTLTRAKPPFYFAEAKGYVADKLCVSAAFSFALVEE